MLFQNVMKIPTASYCEPISEDIFRLKKCIISYRCRVHFMIVCTSTLQLLYGPKQSICLFLLLFFIFILFYEECIVSHIERMGHESFS